MRIPKRPAGQSRPLVALAIGVVGVVAVTISLTPLSHELAKATGALLLVVPVIAAAVVGGRVAAYLVALAATASFSLLLPPFGSPRVALTQDLIALGVFLLVAVTVSALVTRRLDALARVEAQRGALLRSVSHDLRTPLSAIRGAASELLEHDVHNETTRRRLLDLVDVEAERLDRLVANLLSLSRIEGGGMAPRLEPVDLVDVVTSCTSRLGRLFEGLHLEIDTTDEAIVVDADHVQLDQVLTNLLENAARHSSPGSTVRVQARRVGRHAELVVSDEGPGVDPADAELIFEPFRSGNVAGASGIGLAICRSIVQAHGGTIDVGGAPSGGAQFTVTLPS